MNKSIFQPSLLSSEMSALQLGIITSKFTVNQIGMEVRVYADLYVCDKNP